METGTDRISGHRSTAEMHLDGPVDEFRSRARSCSYTMHLDLTRDTRWIEHQEHTNTFRRKSQTYLTDIPPCSVERNSVPNAPVLYRTIKWLRIISLMAPYMSPFIHRLHISLHEHQCTQNRHETAPQYSAY